MHRIDSNHANQDHENNATNDADLLEACRRRKDSNTNKQLQHVEYSLKSAHIACHCSFALLMRCFEFLDLRWRQNLVSRVVPIDIKDVIYTSIFAKVVQTWNEELTGLRFELAFNQ